MATTTKSRSHFGDTLRGHLEANKVAGRQPNSIRQLARHMGNGDPRKAEAAKRSIFKWLSGQTQPSATSRVLVATVLGVDPSAFADDDEEEDEPMLDLVRALMHRIDLKIEEALARREQA